jgi:hypothetical protein
MSIHDEAAARRMREQTEMIRQGRKAALVFGTIIFLLLAIGLIGCPQYKVYKKTQDGKAALEQAKQDRQIAIEEAQANLASEALNAKAEVERAKGAAEAIKIEDGQLSDRYIRYLFVRQTDLSNAQTIYIPTEGGLPLLEAGKRP